MNNTGLLIILTEYARRGWKLFPCRSKTETWTDRKTGEVHTAAAKTPLVKNWPEAATTDARKISQWLEQFPGCMWAVATGSASKFFAIDLDRHKGGADGVQAFREYCVNNRLPLPKTLAQNTAGGGVQMFFEMPAGEPVRTAAGILPGVDVRGDGGYVIITPSYNQENGRAYQWQAPGVSIMHAPAWLLKLVSQKGRPAPVQDAKAPQTGAQAPYSGPDGGTAYGLRALRDELATLRDAEQGTRNDTLNRAGVKLFALAAGGELDADTVAAELKAAASMIGLPASEAAATIASARKAGYASPRKAPDADGADYSGMTVNGQAPARAEALKWDPPVDFAAHEVPVLDTANLPPLLRDYVEGLAEALQVPRELVLAMSIAALSTAAQWRYQVKIRAGYHEPVNTYVVCALEPGNRKSATVAAVCKPLRAWEREQKDKLAPIIEKATSKRLTMQKAITAKREKAAKVKPEEMETLQAEIEEMERSLPDIPSAPRLLADNITPEELAVLMAEMRECLAIMTAEGGIFDILAGMYSQKTPNLDLFLKAHSGGDSFRVDRRNAPPVILDNPLLTLGMAPQPVTLAERSAGRIFRGRGLDARFLYFLPKSLLGQRKIDPAPIDPGLENDWGMLLLSILPAEWHALGDPDDDPAIDDPGPDDPERLDTHAAPPPSWLEDPTGKVDLALSDGAYHAWMDFAGAVEKELADNGELSVLKDWASKLPGAVARIAGLFHIVTQGGHDPEMTPISQDTMAQAVYMGAFLTEHAKAAYQLMGSDERTEGAKKVLSWIQRTKANSFTTQQCWQATKGTFHHMEPLRDALRELEERGFIRETPSGRLPMAGRPPSPAYDVNPQALKG